MIMKNFLQETYGLPQKRCFLHPPHIVLLAFFGDSSCFYLLLSVFYLEKFSSFLFYFYLCPQATKPITYVTSIILMNL